jgi:hypothetical protein
MVAMVILLSLRRTLVLFFTRVIAGINPSVITVKEKTDMPGETHQIGYDIDADSVLALLQVLLGLSEVDVTGDTTLAGLGIDDYGAMDLWQAVCEEFSERTLGPEIDPDLFDPAMTVATAAAAMAAELTHGGHPDV